MVEHKTEESFKLSGALNVLRRADSSALPESFFIEYIPKGLTVEMVSWDAKLPTCEIKIPNSPYRYKGNLIVKKLDFLAATQRKG